MVCLASCCPQAFPPPSARQKLFPCWLHAVRRKEDDGGDDSQEAQWAGRLGAIRAAIDKESASVKAHVAGQVAGLEAKMDKIEQLLRAALPAA